MDGATTHSTDWLTIEKDDHTRWRSPDRTVEIIVRPVETTAGQVYNCTAMKSEIAYGPRRQVGSKIAHCEAAIEKTVKTLYRQVY